MFIELLVDDAIVVVPPPVGAEGEVVRNPRPALAIVPDNIVVPGVTAKCFSAYGFDSYARLNSLTQDFTGPGADLTLTYALNEASQLTSRTYSNSSYISHPSTANKAYATGGPNNYTSAAGASYSYDTRKNLTSDGMRTFTYDSENRLLTASAPTAVTLTYDPLGRLQTSATSSATTTLLYAGSFLAAEYSGSTVTQRYVPDASGSEPVVWYQGSGTSTPQTIQTDELGSVIATSNASGANSAIYGYGPNGEPSSAWTGSRYSYTGQIMIPEAQVYYYHNRIYDPVMGRFLQTDPVGYSSDINLYAYGGNDSVNNVDPTGKELVGALVGGLVGGSTALAAEWNTPDATPASRAVAFAVL
jgi:RHS repeat-associated protein